ncbi:MAG: NHL repeat-containing protein [Pirellulaceae bacterium]
MYGLSKSGLRPYAAPCFSLALLILLTAPLPGAEWVYPLSLAVQDSGTVFLADRNLPGIWRLEGEQLHSFFQGSKQFRTPLNAVRCVAVDRDGNLLAGDSATRDVYRFDASGKPQPLTAQGKKFGQIGIPMDIVTDADGNLIVSDLEIHRIVRVPKNGGNVEEIATINAPRGLFYDSKNQLWVIANRKLVRLSPEGKQETIVDDGVFQYPHTVVVSTEGTAYVCDGYAKTIWKVVPGQKPVKFASGDPLVNPVGMDLLGDKILVVDPRAKAVFEIDKLGKLTRREVKLAE